MNRLQSIVVYALSLAGMTLGIHASGPGLADSYADQGGADAAMRPVQFSTAFIGMHTLSPARHWPSVAFGSIRPAGVTWGAIETARGEYNWQPLDFWVSQTQAHGVQLDYVFLNTPRWASTRPDEPCTGKRFGCAAPPNLDDWDGFVRALATRYKGKISSYELWNEPNASGFWSGSPQQMVELAAHAYPIIKSIDPAAIVTTPAASSTGWPLSHDAWLDQYLSAGGGKYADVIAWHGYAGRNDQPALPPEDLSRQIDVLRQVLAKHQLSQLPIWDTEGGWGKDAQLPDETTQASFLVKWYVIQFNDGISRAYWYQWDNPDWGTLWRDGGGETPAGAAAQQVVSWLSDVTAARPCRPSPGSKIWSCALKKGSAAYRIAWSTSGQAPFDDSAKVASFTEMGGAKQTPSSQTLMVSSRPTLFELK